MCMLQLWWPLRPWRPPTDLEVTYELRFELGDLNYLQYVPMLLRPLHAFLKVFGKTFQGDKSIPHLLRHLQPRLYHDVIIHWRDPYGQARKNMLR